MEGWEEKGEEETEGGNKRGKGLEIILSITLIGKIARKSGRREPRVRDGREKGRREGSRTRRVLYMSMMSVRKEEKR